jgi:hypothetical protein
MTAPNAATKFHLTAAPSGDRSTSFLAAPKTWMAGTGPAMTVSRRGWHGSANSLPGTTRYLTVGSPWSSETNVSFRDHDEVLEIWRWNR